MAGSEKLYLQPILADLLDGLSTSIESIDGIVDGLGEAVSDMKTAVEAISGTIESVETTIEATNEALAEVNESIIGTSELVVYPFYHPEDHPIYGQDTYYKDKNGSWEVDEEIFGFDAHATGSVRFAVYCKGSSGVAANNPGLYLKNIVDSTELSLCNHAPISAGWQTNLSASVVKGGSYRLYVKNTGSSGNYVTVSGEGIRLCFQIQAITPDKAILPVEL